MSQTGHKKVKALTKKKKTQEEIHDDNDNGDNNDDDIGWSWIFENGIGFSFISIAVFGLLVRLGVSLHPYSGAKNPPKYGDFEAQRHWMEITLNVPIRDWYRNTTQNDLSYWGLDYPPLTAYQSYFHGLFLRIFHPESVSLFVSRGHESYLGKLLMRWTVLSSDVLVFFPAVLCFAILYHNGHKSGRKSKIAWHIATILLNPCLILIDHGHFQYNCISLGLTVGAITSILADKDLVGSVLFSLALNHKQMSAYFAPAFFSHLLGKCLRRRNPLVEVVKLGTVVLATFAIMWWPYLHSTEAFFQVLSRLTPFERGIYEDYVANFWCTTSVLIKWKRLFTTPSLKLLSLGATILTLLPSMIQQIWSPSKKGFLYGLLNSAFSFYLFSFQVHEKSILLPLIPSSLLAIEEPFLHNWMTVYALFSMFPLLVRDKLVLPYIALLALFYLITRTEPNNRSQVSRETSSLRSSVIVILLSCALALHVVYLTLKPPERYPFLFEAFIMLLCFSQFVYLAAYTNIKQLTMFNRPVLGDHGKKLL